MIAAILSVAILAADSPDPDLSKPTLGVNVVPTELTKNVFLAGRMMAPSADLVVTCVSSGALAL
jgi:hypothetical protein